MSCVNRPRPPLREGLRRHRGRGRHDEVLAVLSGGGEHAVGSDPIAGGGGCHGANSRAAPHVSGRHRGGGRGRSTRGCRQRVDLHVQSQLARGGGGASFHGDAPRRTLFVVTVVRVIMNE